jgi:hypothetical protein
MNPFIALLPLALKTIEGMRVFRMPDSLLSTAIAY